MSNDDSTVSDDLELDLQDGGTNDSSIDAGENSADDQSTEEVTTDLDLDSKEEQDEKAQRREAAKQQHAKSWAEKIKLGKASLKDVPESIRFLLPQIKELAGIEEKKEEKKEELTIKEAIRLESLKEKLRAADLEPEQIKAFNSKRRYFLGKGFNELEATQEAIEFASIDLNARHEMPKIKVGGSPKTSKPEFSGTEDPTKLSRKQLADAVNFYQQVGR